VGRRRLRYSRCVLAAVSGLVARRYGRRIRAAAPGVRLCTPREGAWPANAQRAEIAYFSEDFWTDDANRRLIVPLFALPEVRWFHTFSAGVDHPAFGALLERGAILTNSAGSSSEPIAQYILGMMLRVSKGMDAWSEAQRERRWLPHQAGELTGRTVGIVGLGHIGSEVARLAMAFNMRVIGCRRRTGRPRYVDQLVSPQRLHDLLAASDFVVLTVPLTASTERLIDAGALSAMRRDAWLINVSRGHVIDEASLLRALQDGTIAGACLDVFEEEPLPDDSTLWSLPNAIVTPHNSGRSPLNFDRATEIFVDNLARYARKRPLRNRIRTRDL
jgi:phosphoglycerate dehydrogenase-like enzyme